MFPQITEEPERRQAERFADRIPAGKRMAALKDLRRKAMKKYLIILLCIFLCVPSAWAIAKAVHIIRYTDGDFAFILLEDGTAEIRRYSGRDTFLEIPSKMKGHPVSGIGDKAFEWRFWMKEVTVPDGVCRIGTGAFSGCYSLETIRLPESLSSIGDRAFALCRELDAPVLPKKLASIGEEAFDGCSGLEKIELPASVTLEGENPFSNCRKLREIRVASDHPFLKSDGTILYNEEQKRLITYYGDPEADTYTVPQGTERIGSGAFSGCSHLKEIFLPDGVLDLQDHAFYGCSGLTRIGLPSSACRIGNGCFSGCSKLTELVIPEGVSSVGYLAFYNCAALSSVTIPESVTQIGQGAFIGCSRLTVRAAPGSPAHSWCEENGLPCEKAASLS